eukprot:SAG11_NODE_1280_length_5314_cov_2.956472_3_plen_155_part_00
MAVEISQLPAFVRLSVHAVTLAASVLALPYLLVITIVQCVITADCFAAPTTERAAAHAFPWRHALLWPLRLILSLTAVLATAAVCSNCALCSLRLMIALLQAPNESQSPRSAGPRRGLGSVAVERLWCRRGVCGVRLDRSAWYTTPSTGKPQTR